MKLDVLILRIAFVGMLILLGYLLNPFERTQRFGLSNIGDEQTRRLLSAALGAVVGVLMIGFEMRVRRASLKSLIGAAVGSILGIVGAFLIGVLISIQKEAAVSAEMQTFLRDNGLRTQAVPEQLELVDVVPRNASGKITKNVLRERFTNRN